jgi:hypothetical protein
MTKEEVLAGFKLVCGRKNILNDVCNARGILMIVVGPLKEIELMRPPTGEYRVQ